MEILKEEASLKGVYTFTKAKLVTPEHFALNENIGKIRDNIYSFEIALCNPYITDETKNDLTARVKALREEMRAAINLLHSVCKTEKIVVENIIPTVGRTMIANNLTSASPTNVMKITHCALGTSGTTPVNGDTQLGTETYRNAIASITNSSNIGYATCFFTATEVTGTFAECGIFSNGTGSANSGVLLSHVLISITKTSTETLTLDWTLTIS